MIIRPAQAKALWNLWKKILEAWIPIWLKAWSQGYLASCWRKILPQKLWLKNQRSNLLIWWNCNKTISSRLNIFFYLVGVWIALLTKENRNNCNKNSLVFSRTAKSSFIHLATFSLINHCNDLQFVMWKLISYRGFLKSSELLYNFLVSLSIFFTNWKKSPVKITLQVPFPLVYFVKAMILQIINVFRTLGLGSLIKWALFDCLCRQKDYISLDLTART